MDQPSEPPPSPNKSPGNWDTFKLGSRFGTTSVLLDLLKLIDAKEVSKDAVPLTRLLAAALIRLRNALLSPRRLLGFALVWGVLCGGMVVLYKWADVPDKTQVGSGIAAVTVVLVLAFVLPLVLEIAAVTGAETEATVASAEAGKLQDELGQDFFTNLVKINFKYLDKYYSQTQVQANKSFLLSAFAAVVALVIIGVGIAMMFVNKTQPAYVTTATGLLGEIIAGVFFYLHNRTVLKMGQYHQKLVLTQNVSLALKIAEGLPESERAKAQMGLIEWLARDINRYLSDAVAEPSRPEQSKVL